MALDEVQMQAAWAARVAHFGRRLHFCRPSATLAVSVTGQYCGLNCAHCGGHYLISMRRLEDADLARAKSLLISGGCDRDGQVPVLPRLPDVLRVGAGKRLNWHLGLVDEATVLALKPHLDVVSFDWVGDDATIQEVYGLDRSVEDYVACYTMLRRHCTVVPHLTIGLHGGQIRGERRALRLLQELGVERLVCNVFIPTPGTTFADRQPPTVEEVAGLLAEARLKLQTVPLLVGCMRPAGAYREALDVLALRTGVTTIVNPALAAVRVAAQMEMEVQWSDECCVL